MALSPALPVFDRFAWQVRQRSLRGFRQNRERIGIADVLVRVDETTNKFVVRVGGKASVFVEVSADGLGVQTVQAEDFFSRVWGGVDGIRARKGRDPLSEGAAGGKTDFKKMIFIVGVVLIPASEVVARRRLTNHRAKGLEQAVFVETHEQVMGLMKLLLVQWAVERHVAIAEFRERSGRKWIRRESQRGTAEAGNESGSRRKSRGLKKSPAGECGGHLCRPSQIILR